MLDDNASPALGLNMKEWIIYKCTNRTNGKVYIGQTMYTIEHRWSGHVHSALRTDSRVPLHCAIRKYGRDAFLLEVVQSASSQEETNKLEVEWIARVGSITPGGYNLQRGGEVSEVHPDTKVRISESWGGPAQRVERSAKISAALLAPEVRARMSETALRRESAWSPAEREALNTKISGRVKEAFSNIPHEEHSARTSAAGLKRWANVPPEERREFVRKCFAGMTPEERRAQRKRAGQAGGEAVKNTPPEVRKAWALKAWETRRANLAKKADNV